MELYLLFLVLGIIVAFLTSLNAPRKSDHSSRKERVILRKNGKQKRYQINQYGEIFED